MSFKSKSMALETVCAPFRNSLTTVLLSPENSHLAANMRRSKLYMIGARPRTDFVNFNVIDPDNDVASVEIEVGGKTVDQGIIHLGKNVKLGERYGVSYDSDIIMIGNHVSPGEKMTAHTWYTPDSIYWEKSRHNKSLAGFNNHSTVCNYDLLYVGIANKQNSFDRLIAKAHQGRTQILSDEDIRYPIPHNRVSDEIILFLFDIEPLIIQKWGIEDEMNDIITEFDSSRSIADAEKAFVSLLKPQYNKVVFQDYPHGRDGLYESGFNVYQYSINENFIFNAPAGTFKGARVDSLFEPSGDTIVIEGDTVKVYPAE